MTQIAQIPKRVSVSSVSSATRRRPPRGSLMPPPEVARAVQDLAGLDARELKGLRFTCLEGCGFCCTFTPEVASGELARLRSRLPALPVVTADDGRTRLAFQGGCGACVL